MRYVKNQYFCRAKFRLFLQIFQMPHNCNTLPIRLLRKLRRILRGGFLLYYN